MGAELARMRDRMVAEVSAGGQPVSDAVAQAMRVVPRHLFLPEVPAELAYRDDAIVTRRDPNGQPTSSSSQPKIMAIMLDQLGLAPGHRVLEIGAGTGYNAALMKHLVGPGGTVVTVDLDEEVAAEAAAHLGAAGYPDVTVVAADGAAGYPPGAPYDRIIATVGVSDLAPAWLAQLGPGGRIVVPLDLRGSQRSVAFERDPDGPAESGRPEVWRSRSVVPCGFMRMRGSLAGPERTRVTGDYPGTGAHAARRAAGRRHRAGPAPWTSPPPNTPPRSAPARPSCSTGWGSGWPCTNRAWGCSANPGRPTPRRWPAPRPGSGTSTSRPGSSTRAASRCWPAQRARRPKRAG